MQRLIYSLFKVIFKASMCCQKTFIMVYLILKNKFLLKTNQNWKYVAYNFCTGETWCYFQTKRKYIGIGQNDLKNIGINPISCIPSVCALTKSTITKSSCGCPPLWLELFECRLPCKGDEGAGDGGGCTCRQRKTPLNHTLTQITY